MTEMSRRDQFAVMILAGMSGNQDITNRLTIQKMAKHAIRTADVLIEQLDELDGESEEKINQLEAEAEIRWREDKAMDELRSSSSVDRKYYGD